MSQTFEPPLMIDPAGWLADVDRIPSPNHDARPAGTAINLLVLHAISLPPGSYGGPAIIDLFTNRLDPHAHPYFTAIAARRVSAHFLIRRDGQILQFVSCLARAWHAGVSCWQGREACNDFSLGIELEGDDDHDFDAAQYASLGRLMNLLRTHYPLEACVGHHDIAAGRKTDPGPHFDWSRLPWS